MYVKIGVLKNFSHFANNQELSDLVNSYSININNSDISLKLGTIKKKSISISEQLQEFAAFIKNKTIDNDSFFQFDNLLYELMNTLNCLLTSLHFIQDQLYLYNMQFNVSLNKILESFSGEENSSFKKKFENLIEKHLRDCAFATSTIHANLSMVMNLRNEIYKKTNVGRENKI